MVNFVAHSQPCTNASQFPLSTQVIPIDGSSINISTKTANYFTATVLTNKAYFVYSTTTTDLTSVWGTTNGTGSLGYGSVAGPNYVFTTNTTGTTMWVNLNKSGTCGGSATARTATVELLPYNISIPSTVCCIGNTITVTGNALMLINLVTFTGGATAVPTVVTATSFNVVIPAGAQSGPISFQSSDGFYILTLAPTTSSLNIQTATGISSSPTGGGVGDYITISGYNLLGATNVRINGTLATNVIINSTTITCTVAAGTTGTGNVTFTDGCGNTATASAFTVVALTNYYSKSTGSLHLPANWGTNTNGSGTAPANFTAAGQRFNIRNNAAPTITSAWTVIGAGSAIIIGDGTASCNFTIPSTLVLTGSILNINANASLTLNNNTLPTLTSCLCSSTSTVIFGMTGAAITIPPITYGNLTLSGSAAGTSFTFGGSCNITNTLTISTTKNVNLNNSSATRTFNIKNFTMSAAGTLDGGSVNPAIGSYNSIIYFTGNFNKTSGIITNSSPSGITSFNFSGGGSQTFNNSGTYEFEITNIKNNTTLTLNSNYTLSGITGTPFVEDHFRIQLTGKPIKTNAMKRVLSLIVFTLIVAQAFAQGDLLVTPKRVVFEGNTQREELSLVNMGKDTATYSISLLQKNMKEDGSFVTIEKPSDVKMSAEPYLRIFPRTVTLAPGEPQVIMIQCRRNPYMASGESRSHLY